MSIGSGRGRGVPRPAVFAALALVLAGAAWLLAERGPEPSRRGPIAVENADAEPATEFLVGRVHHVVAPDAPERLLPDTLFPTGPVRLLWLQGRATAPLPDGGVLALDGAGGIIHFDPELTQHRPFKLGRREIVSAAATRGGTTWMTDAAGTLLRAARNGELRPVASRSFQYPSVAADPRAADVWLVRRQDRWSYRLPGAAPLLVKLGAGGTPAGTVGQAFVPHDQLLGELASAGHIAVAGDTVYFAPFIRDEIIAFSPQGDTLWVASRELPQSTSQPRITVSGKSGMIDYFPVNLGVALGPDDRLYVLSTPGFTTSAGRLDVFDRANGHLLKSARLATALPTVASDSAGRVYLLDEFRLLTGVPPSERERFADFSLERMSGGTASLGDLQGKVVLINFWASWCEPCRTEMPALDSLRREISDPDFLFLTMNEDINRADAERFVREFGFDFPVLLGRGRLRERYHYIGLPFTVLLDRDGRVVRRWIGFAGPEQIQAEKAVIKAELARELSGAPAHQHH